MAYSTDEDDPLLGVFDRLSAIGHKLFFSGERRFTNDELRPATHREWFMTPFSLHIYIWSDEKGPGVFLNKIDVDSVEVPPCLAARASLLEIAPMFITWLTVGTMRKDSRPLCFDQQAAEIRQTWPSSSGTKEEP